MNEQGRRINNRRQLLNQHNPPVDAQGYLIDENNIRKEDFPDHIGDHEVRIRRSTVGRREDENGVYVYGHSQHVYAPYYVFVPRDTFLVAKDLPRFKSNIGTKLTEYNPGYDINTNDVGNTISTMVDRDQIHYGQKNNVVVHTIGMSKQDLQTARQRQNDQERQQEQQRLEQQEQQRLEQQRLEQQRLEQQRLEQQRQYLHHFGQQVNMQGVHLYNIPAYDAGRASEATQQRLEQQYIDILDDDDNQPATFHQDAQWNWAYGNNGNNQHNG